MSASRRDFLKILSVFPLIGASGKEAEAARPLLLNRFSIADFQYHDGPALMHRPRRQLHMIREIDSDNSALEEVDYHGADGTNPHELHPGGQLDLKAEPSNPHDPFAVEIYRGKAKLGYVPRSDNEHISRLPQQGAELECRVVEIDPAVGVWNMVRVQVVLVRA
jgi:hypothetical protein